MKAYNYLDVDVNNMSLIIEDSGMIYEFFEPCLEILESCEDWNSFDCRNYMRNNYPFDVREMN